MDNMNDYLDQFNKFSDEAFNMMEFFMLQLFMKAKDAGMDDYDARIACKGYIRNRVEERYLDTLLDHALLARYDFPGVSREDK